MKAILTAILLCLMISCLDEKDDYVYYIKKIGAVQIDEALIPDTAKNLEFVQIKSRASANNGCWKDLNFELKAINTYEYTLKAYGTYESYGVCPDIMVYRDTIIQFKPIQKGSYLFYITRKPSEIDIDTMLVE